MRFFKEILQESDGKFSHKRVITVLSFIVLLIAFFTNTYWGIAVSEFLLDNFMFIVIGGMGITASATVGTKLLGRDSKAKD